MPEKNKKVFATLLSESLTADNDILVYGDKNYDGYYLYSHEWDTVKDYIFIYNNDGKIKKAIDLPVEKALNNIADFTHPNRKATEFIKNEVMQDIKYKNWLFNIMGARYTGVSVSLVVPEYKNGKLLINEIYTINPEYYIPYSGISEKKIKFNALGLFDKEISRTKLIVYAHDPQFTDPYGTSIIAAIQKDYEEKKIAEYAYRQFLRRFGIPGLLFYLPDDADKPEMDELVANMTKVLAGGVGAIPSLVQENGKWENTYQHDIIEIAKGTSDFAAFVKRKDGDIMTSLGVPSILFNTDESGSYSLGAIHKEMFNLTIQRCQNAIQSIFCNQIVQPLLEANFGISEHGQLIFQDVEGRALKELSQSVSVLNSTGLFSNEIPSLVRTQYEILGIKATDEEIEQVCAINKEKRELLQEQAEQKQNNIENNISGRTNADSARPPHGTQVKGRTGGLDPKKNIDRKLNE
jgi:hypothetical protein